MLNRDMVANLVATERETELKEKIRLFIEMEKLKLVSRAIQLGESELDVCSFLDEENIPDFDLDNLKSRLETKRSTLLTEPSELTVSSGDIEKKPEKQAEPPTEAKVEAKEAESNE